MIENKNTLFTRVYSEFGFECLLPHLLRGSGTVVKSKFCSQTAQVRILAPPD